MSLLSNNMQGVCKEPKRMELLLPGGFEETSKECDEGVGEVEA